jgi:hypothetical protein
MLLDLASCERRGEKDSGVAFAIVQVDRNDEFLLAEVLDVCEVGATAIRQRVAGAIGAETAAPDAVRVGESEQ